VRALGSFDWYGKHGCFSHAPAFVALPAGQTLLVAVAKRNAEHGYTTVDIELVSGVPSNDQTVNDPGAIVGGGGRRFPVPQYEADDPTGCCAATVLQRPRITQIHPPKPQQKKLSAEH
jgi:hypothetical protein